MTKEIILQEAKKEDIRFIRLIFTDIEGMIKNVEIPVGKLEEALDNKIMFDGSSIEGFTRIQEADMRLFPDIDTWLVSTFENGKYGKVGRLICDVHLPNGDPFKGDPRYVMKETLKKMKALGFESFHIGVEPEFFLFKEDALNNGTLDMNDQGGYFDLAPVDGAEDCRRDIVNELSNLRFEMEAAHHEVAPGQHEINFEFKDALKACDQLQTFKWVVKNVAKRHGYHATFMPKPIASVNGSGMHTNTSLSLKGGVNAFNDETKPLGLSDTTLYWIGGLLKHAKSFTAITNPLVNSYKRLVPGFEAPVYIAWSDANRSAMIRIPAVRGNATRAEIRSVDPAANPYLAFSLILAAGLDGIKNKIMPPKNVSENIYRLTLTQKEDLKIEALPSNLYEALSYFKESDLVKETLGEHIKEGFIKLKTNEWDDFRQTVTKWEIDRNLRRY